MSKSTVSSQSRRTSGGPAVLIVATTPWPLSARMASRMIAHGCSVAALCPRGHALTKVSRIREIHSYSGFDALAGLTAAIAAVQPELIVPCDDRAVWLLHELYGRAPQLRPVVEASLGDAGSFAIVRSRGALLEQAAGMGIRVPETRTIASEGDIANWLQTCPLPAVLKMDGTWGGSGVQIVSSAEEAAQGWKRFHAPPPPGSRWKRWIINKDPLAFWETHAHSEKHVTIQGFIAGREANAMVAAWRGQVLGAVAVEVLCRQGKKGASTIVRLIRDEEIVNTGRGLVERLGLSGFYGFDFIIEEGTEAPYLIEMNPRCTQLGHLVLSGQGDLAGMICEKLGARGARGDVPIDRELVAFFPQALAWNPDSPHMQQSHHDVPWNEPELVRELLRDPWAERQWLARLYHWARGKQREPLPSAADFMRLAAQKGFASSPVAELSDIR